jgi:sulfur transfer complex TusBCD TusB component (DsrH family)
MPIAWWRFNGAGLKKILYLVKDSNPATTTLLPEDASPDQAVSIVLLQDAVRRRDLNHQSIHALSDDVEARGFVPSCPVVSYHDLLRMIFEADSVVAL